ncbi:MAG TPA: DUF6572 domain-containing protein [Pyrinomonadaceae bacterium]|nr:DUF6572 domain-containing protein [Pyrinomonadaceae bacterium]
MGTRKSGGVEKELQGVTVEQTKVIDFISVDQNGPVVLTISDHLEWEVTAISFNYRRS